MFSHIKELFTRPSGYQISRSVRLRSSASAYFNRTFGTTGNRKTFTFSGWVKKAVVGSSTGAVLFCSTDNSTSTGWLHFNLAAVGSTDTLTFQDQLSNTVLVTTQLFRDPSAWYHIILAIDTTQATASDRAKLYVNGTQVTAFSTATYPTQNADTNFNRSASFSHTIGTQVAGSRYFDGYLTEINFIDGQALTPSSFGQTNTVTGVWQPIKYTGTYGNNGFYLNFSDNSNNTATTIGKDYSGNGNNWTPNNISVTAGVTYDSMLDVPTPYADGGNGRGNYAVLNPLSAVGGPTINDGNLKLAGTDDNGLGTIAIPSSGKWYFEGTVIANGSNVGIGIQNIDGVVGAGTTNDSDHRIYASNGYKYAATGTAGYGATYTVNDVIGVAVNMDTGDIEFFKNNVSQGVAFTDLISTGFTWIGKVGTYNLSGTWAINFGQRPFTYTPPTGFKALNTQNLPTPTISNGATVMAATTYTGSASTQVINSNMTALDFAWIKNRTTARSHALVDTVRGGSPMWTLFSDLTAAESNTSPNYNPTSISGSSITLGGATLGLNNSGENFVMWGWNAGGSTVTNTSGTISSQVRANPTAGFSIVTYTGTGANATVGHGLNATPAMIIVKNRDSGAIGGAVYHTRLGATKYLKLFQTTTGTDGEATDNTAWNGSSPTFNSSVFSVGSLNRTNSSQQMVAYCFAAVAGYSAFGSYTGNNSTDGVFVYLGFRARFLMIKRTDGLGGWVMLDTARDTYNDVDNYLYANSSAADAGSSNVLDINSNGFKIRNSWTDINASGGTYVYMAFCENPFKFSNAR